ncbi:hypothetical protein LOD59_00020 [Xylella fastidiosa subsp. multiplex]|uniref:hypothetical protein n=1 Tax=Xylella fastidiosa TaxID=2371 RepID=UPI00235EBD51|nr:hypothetical protein [Xylella fastidiosa]MDD0926067.1 hypothetical protein [Xylella fastidiosa subsp. multiplex]
MGQGSASQIIPRHPTTQRPNDPTTQRPNHPTTQPPNHPTTQPPNHPTTQPPNHPTTQLPNYPITQLPKRQTTTQLKQCYGRAGPTISRTSAAACIVCRDRIYIPPLQHLIMPGRLAEDHP